MSSRCFDPRCADVPALTVSVFSKCFPRLSKDAIGSLQNEYVAMREDVRAMAKDTGSAAIPITIRYDRDDVSSFVFAHHGEV